MRPVTVCRCRFCHDGEGVDVNDPMEAAIACPRCYPNHSHAIRLISNPLTNPPRPADACGDPTDEGPE
ncbi:MAG TPA: hypothetical protein VM165_12355 [Planctomycetaceae bacterium]|nr:hypothetical protein [Planctomycetaceae bacterium]